MPNTILVVAEQRDGKLNRASWETITAAQAIAAETGWTVEAAVCGSGIEAVARELAAKEVAKVYALESPALAPYTADGFSYALKQFVGDRKPHLVLMPHTYQVRDFVPKLAAALGAAVISDCIGYRVNSGALVLTRQMFQGKFTADVVFTGQPPFFATFQ